MSNRAFRGHDAVAPQGREEESYAFSCWERRGEQGLWFPTQTWGNPTTTTGNTQGVGLTVASDADTLIQGWINGQKVEVPLADLLEGPKTGYLGGFLTPACCFHRTAPRAEYASDIEFSRLASGHSRDWYYIRVR